MITDEELNDPLISREDLCKSPDVSSYHKKLSSNISKNKERYRKKLMLNLLISPKHGQTKPSYKFTKSFLQNCSNCNRSFKFIKVRNCNICQIQYCALCISSQLKIGGNSVFVCEKCYNYQIELLPMLYKGNVFSYRNNMFFVRLVPETNVLEYNNNNNGNVYSIDLFDMSNISPYNSANSNDSNPAFCSCFDFFSAILSNKSPDKSKAFVITYTYFDRDLNSNIDSQLILEASNAISVTMWISALKYTLEIVNTYKNR